MVRTAGPSAKEFPLRVFGEAKSSNYSAGRSGSADQHRVNQGQRALADFIDQRSPAICAIQPVSERMPVLVLRPRVGFFQARGKTWPPYPRSRRELTATSRHRLIQQRQCCRSSRSHSLLAMLFTRNDSILRDLVGPQRSMTEKVSFNPWGGHDAP